MSARRPRPVPWLKATCLAYLLGSLGGFFHPLEEGGPFECLGADAGSSRATLSPPCSGPSCPDPAHRHNPRPIHDPANCVVCQFHHLDGAPAPCGEAPSASTLTGKLLTGGTLVPDLSSRAA